MPDVSDVTIDAVPVLTKSGMVKILSDGNYQFSVVLFKDGAAVLKLHGFRSSTMFDRIICPYLFSQKGILNLANINRELEDNLLVKLKANIKEAQQKYRESHMRCD